MGASGAVEIEMVERRVRPDALRRGGEAALVLGEGVGVERVLPGQVLDVNEDFRARDAVAERRRRLDRGRTHLPLVSDRAQAASRRGSTARTPDQV